MAGAHVADAADARLDAIFKFLQQFRGDPELDAEHQLLALIGGLDRLGGELRLGRDEGDRRRDDVVRGRVEQDARLVADRQSTGSEGGDKDGQIDVGEIEQCDHRRAGADDFAGLYQLVFDAAAARRLQHAVVDQGLDAGDIGARGIGCGLGGIRIVTTT
eukprot:gene22855-24144_t